MAPDRCRRGPVAARTAARAVPRSYRTCVRAQAFEHGRSAFEAQTTTTATAARPID
jgi:hypothetical protein